MKNYLLLAFFFFYVTAIQAQPDKNLIELGKNAYYFSNTNENYDYWAMTYEINLAYSRRLKDNLGFRFGAGFFSKENALKEERRAFWKKGDVSSREFLIFELSGFYSFLKRNKSEMNIYMGGLYRFGQENHFIKTREHMWGDEDNIYTYRNDGTGLAVGLNYGYQVFPKWNIKGELGYHQFFQGENVSLHNFYGGVKIGYLF